MQLYVAGIHGIVHITTSTVPHESRWYLGFSERIFIATVFVTVFYIVVVGDKGKDPQ